jgi:hypothetical protein
MSTGKVTPSLGFAFPRQRTMRGCCSKAGDRGGCELKEDKDARDDVYVEKWKMKWTCQQAERLQRCSIHFDQPPGGVHGMAWHGMAG